MNEPGAAFGEGATGRAGPCPCGSGTAYDACCGPCHAGAPARTAEALMRSRYSAFALGETDYLLRTWHPRTRPAHLDLAAEHRWVGLEVLSTTGGGVGDALGTVTYRATSRGRDGVRRTLTERARFERRGGRWTYLAGDVLD